MVPDCLAAGHPVKIELDDGLVPGEICYCYPCERGFALGVQLEQALQGLTELERLNHALLGGELVSRKARSDRRLGIQF